MRLTPLKAWIARNEESLRLEYRSHRDAHDYCLHDGNDNHRHFYSFETYARFAYGLWLEEKRHESKVS